MRIIVPLVLYAASYGELLAEGAPAARSFDISQRIPWTTSRVIGSPDPPPPYRVRKDFAKLKIAQPIAVEHEPGAKNLLLVNQDVPWVGKGSVLRLAEDSDGGKTEVLMATDRTIYSLAFHPEYEKNGYLYVGGNGPVTAKDKNIPGRRFRPRAKKTSAITRYTVSREPPFGIVPGSEQVIIEWPSNGHNGAGVAFGKDGMMYVTSGDGTSDSDTDLAGQDLTRLLAKVLRIDVNHPDKDRPYSVPKDNPFVGVKEARPETWAYGFRNPWRLHVDRKNGDVWVGQNGQDLWEQVYLVRRGANYGWSLFEGSHPFQPDRRQGPTPISRPIADHHHSEARSLTGGVVYHGKELPELRGVYIYGDWSTGKMWGIRHRQGKVTWHKELADTVLQVAGIGADSQGELLIVDYGGGLYRLEKTPQGQRPNTRFPGRLSETGLFTSVKDHQMHAALIPYSVNSPLWSDGAIKERWIALPGETQIKFKSKGGWDFPDGAVLVKTFSLEQESGAPSSRWRIETRLLTRQQGEWQGYTYVWNQEQTDATLVERGGADLKLALRDAAAPGGKRVQTWRLPSRAECMVCHSRAANFVLGPNVLQMNKVHDYGAAKPGDAENSILYQRITRRGRGQMPPLATSLVDRRAAKLLRKWISKMPLRKEAREAP